MSEDFKEECERLIALSEEPDVGCDWADALRESTFDLQRAAKKFRKALDKE